MLQLHHKINIALMGLTPVALVAGGGLQTGLDLILGIVLPLHGHIGMNQVVTDYAKKIGGKGAIGPSRMGLAVLTGTTMLGLLKLNLSGPGLTETVKSFWRPKA
jgi:succinate dehydrogenase (ubiquinone) membrane anchor subunit